MKKPKFTNPWASEEAPKSVGIEAEAPREPTVFEVGDAVGDVPTADVRLGTYGGVGVRNASTPTEALLAVLSFLVTHYAVVDPVLTEYAVLLAKFDAVPAQGFYIRRSSDGWTLSVPDAKDRDQALLQIVQALLVISRGPLRRPLADAGIRPYRM